MPEDTTDTPVKAKPETWRDWLEGDAEPPADQLLTREQVLDFLASRGVDATLNDLRFWEYEGVLPRAVRRWHKGAVRAIYPPWFPAIVQELRRLQEFDKVSLDGIGPRLRAYVRAGPTPVVLGLSGSASAHSSAAATMTTVSAADHGGIGVTDRAAVRVLSDGVNNDEDTEQVVLWPGLVGDLQRLARQWTARSGIAVRRVEIHLDGANGRIAKFSVPIDEIPSGENAPPPTSKRDHSQKVVE